VEFYFFIGITIIVIGFGLIIWLLWNEKRRSQPHTRIKQQEAKSEEVSASGLLKRAGLSQLPGTGTAGLRLDQLGDPSSSVPKDSAVLQAESELALKLDDLKIQHEDLKKKYQKLDQLLQDRMAVYDKAEKSLANELKNRKEFNKIKDLLEKELRDKKDECRQFQIEMKNAQTEAQSHLKRIDQLEESLKKAANELKEQQEAALKATENNKKEQQHIVKLEEILQKKEESIKEKDKKIELLMHHLKDAGTRSGAGSTVVSSDGQQGQIPTGAETKGGSSPPSNPLPVSSEASDVSNQNQ
jgi:chromosome segregation ATPase